MRMSVRMLISFVPLLELVSHDLHRLTVHVICRDMLRAHNALLHVYASHGQVEKAKQLYRSMQERGPAIDAVSGSTIIAAYAKVALALHSIHHVQSSLHNWFASIALVDRQQDMTWLISLAESRYSQVHSQILMQTLCAVYCMLCARSLLSTLLASLWKDGRRMQKHCNLVHSLTKRLCW